MIVNATLRYCNYYNQEPYQVATHVHKHWEMVWYGGSGISTVNQIPYNYIPGSYVMIPENVPHSEDGMKQGEIICIGFETDLPRDTFRRCFYVDKDSSIERICRTIVAEIKDEPLYYSYRINLLLRDLLLQTMRKYSTGKKEPDEKLHMILNYLDAYCTTDIDFRELADALNYSYDYLRHYFKVQKNMSLKQYIIRRRIDLAREYLTSDMPIGQIARECGFSSSAHFAATFRQIVGQTPSQFRDNCGEIITERNDPIFMEE